MIIEIKNNSVYFSDAYPSNFDKLYKGVIVVVDNTICADGGLHFAIRTKKVKETIFKTFHEKMYSLSFNDIDHTIHCEFDKCKKNKTPDFVTYDVDTYNELRDNIPPFMKKVGCEFEIVATEVGIDLVF